MRTLRSATAFFCSSGYRRCVSRRMPWTSADVLMVNIFQFFLGLLKMLNSVCVLVLVLVIYPFWMYLQFVYSALIDIH